MKELWKDFVDPLEGLRVGACACRKSADMRSMCVLSCQQVADGHDNCDVSACSETLR
jgi:hypothetical protein